ncbi:MAG: type II secretion system protein [Candidatus Zixiibacteriota bacterium]
MLTKIKRAVVRVLVTKDGGFTLVEIMASMVIFATGLLLMVPMIVTSQNGNVFADRTTKAGHYIQAKIEEIKNTHNFTSGQDSPEGMTRTWTIETLGTFLTKITLQMTWVDKDGAQHNDVTVTYESHN